MPAVPMQYWSSRSKLEYYAVVRSWLAELGPQESILDVGAWDTPCATWGDFRRRYTIDPKSRPSLPGVLSIVGRWPEDRMLVPLPVSVVLCLQTLEHMPEPTPFAKELFAASSTIVILSVPWGWPAGSTPGHIHDPVDATKLEEWTVRRPDELRVVGSPARAVAVYRCCRTHQV